MLLIDALHCDGFVLLFVSLLLAHISHTWQRWLFRVPGFALAFCNFALALNLLGLDHARILPPWIWFRVGGDVSVLGLAILYVYTRAKAHARPIPGFFHREKRGELTVASFNSRRAAR